MNAGEDAVGRQDLGEALAEIAQHVIAVDAQAVTGVERRGRAADEYRSWYQVLKVAFGGQESFPVRQFLDRRHGK